MLCFLMMVYRIHSARTSGNKAVHTGSYFKRPKGSPVRPSAFNWYYSVQFIAKPKAALHCASAGFSTSDELSP